MLEQQDIKKMDVKALDSKIADLQKQLFDIKIQRFTSGLTKPHLKKELRTTVARLLTERTAKLKK
ncbi:MAG: 50S ribosomal protein L29 [Bdellovibrionales bacterium GWA2_49_15]|nr:MAG: 50S ribosomal protein L29 [Bdellovibrionales bacterium GWA2_49_15]HAZ12757.1 50S ribosomal protein L29 [Bdellovibrionales bacterium]